MFAPPTAKTSGIGDRIEAIGTGCRRSTDQTRFADCDAAVVSRLWAAVIIRVDGAAVM
jgi:hypothetical protein